MTGWVLSLLAVAVVSVPPDGTAAGRLRSLMSPEAGRDAGTGTAGGGDAGGAGTPEGARLLDMIGVCLSAGLPVDRALEAVAGLGGGESEVCRELGLAAGRLRLGTAPDAIWSASASDPVLRRLGDVLRRTAVSGAAATASLEQASARLRAERAAADVARAERAGVMVAGPLGLCFLPAFVVLGIVPVVAGLAGDVLPAVGP